MSPALAVALVALATALFTLAVALGVGLYVYRLRWGRLHDLGKVVDGLEREREWGRGPENVRNVQR